VTTSSQEAYRLYVQGKEHYDKLMFSEAAGEFRQALEHDDGFALARLRLGMSLHQSGEQEAALDLFDESIAEVDHMPEAEGLLTRGIHAYFSEGDLEAGSGYLGDLVQQFPNNNEARVWWAQAFTDLEGDHFQAARKLREAIEQDPNNLAAIAGLAEQLANLGAVEDAEAMCEEAIQRNPEAVISLRYIIDPSTP
jgi:tetratricopeptide (TPR) repeat protein